MDKHMDSTLIVDEHSVPAPVVGAIAEHVFAGMTTASIPTLDDHASVEGEVNPADGVGSCAGTCNLPFAEPVVELAIL